MIEYVRCSDEIAAYGPMQKAGAAIRATWSQRTYRDLRRVIREHRADIVHCHNLHPLVSPSVYYACRSCDVSVVQTLHNYRLSCPAGTLFRPPQACCDCSLGLGRAVARGCYRNSHLQTLATTVMLQVHRALGTWERLVDAYIAPSRFCRYVALGTGLPVRRVHVKPHFLFRDPGQREGGGGYAIFIGRLSPEKGLLPLINAWVRLPRIPLIVAGEGPLRAQAEALAESAGARNIHFTGALAHSEVIDVLRGASFLIFPSRCYETFGLAILEAAACGIPAIASHIGAVPELVIDRRTGLLFDPLETESLVDAALWAWEHPRAMDDMGAAARELYLERYTAEKNYELMLKVYESALTRTIHPAPQSLEAIARDHAALRETTEV